MTTNRRWHIGPARRFTRNMLLPVTLNGRPLILKYNRNPDEAQAEIRGHSALAGHYRLPALLTHKRVPGGRVLVYERLPITTGRGLLLDLLNIPGPPTSELRDYMTTLTDTYRRAIATTARLLNPQQLVRKLFWDRAGAGGRLDDYYADNDFPFHATVPISDLAQHTLIVNNRELQLDWQHTLACSASTSPPTSPSGQPSPRATPPTSTSPTPSLCSTTTPPA